MKYITSTYTIDQVDTDNLEGELLRTLAAEIAAGMDWEIISELLSSDGWIKVSLSFHNRKQPPVNEIQDWVIENIQGSFNSHGNSWLFRDEKDAALFALRWVDG